MSATVHLGYEVGTGAAVAIPLRHMVVTGQTQEAGKTTTLEALIARSGVKAVAFITKRGEGSFGEARIIPPYFREQADWQFVASILEASRGEKLKFERSWIIRASKGAHTLADVQLNVRRAMTTAKGLSADVYLTLDAYLQEVVPQIARVQWATSVQLAPGISAMDLTALNVEMQHLVIRSTLDWVLNHEQDTIVVVPEAWKFIPQGRGTPVKLGAEAYIRQAAGLRNYLWLDSQDIAGVEKMILKSVPVWILGVQRESNEVERTLDQIPRGMKKPKAEDIATLGLGQFYACYGTTVTKVYVQPSWMSASEAQAIADGHPRAVAIERAAPARRAPAPTQEVQVNEQEARALREENAELKRQVGELQRQIRPPAVPSAEVDIRPDKFTDEFYEQIKRRLIADADLPAVLKLLTTRPEIQVTVTPKTIEIDEFSMRGRIARLLHAGFFAEPRGCAAVRGALKRTGPDANTANIGRVLDEFTKLGFVTDEGSGYKEVPDMKVNIVEAA